TQYRSKTQAVPQPHQRTPYNTHPLHRQTVPPLQTPQQTVPPLQTPQRQGQPEPMRQVAVPQMLAPYFQMWNQVER
ncbi:MAG: hypothetical protein FWD31_09800, partial [Planctomycetaceae bacterium]|nr:hypothetical protein [Planctomycetaceae bacterium]